MISNTSILSETEQFVKKLEDFFASQNESNSSFSDDIVYAIQHEKVIHKWENEENIQTLFQSAIPYLKQLLSTDFTKGENSKRVGVLFDASICFNALLDLFTIILSGNQCILLEEEEKLPLYSFIATQIDPEQKQILFGKAGAKFCSHLIIHEHKEISETQLTYIQKKKNLIFNRKKSIAVLDGNETPEEMRKLGNDVIFASGRKAQSVNLIFVPKDYKFVPLFDQWQKFTNITENNRYANNYDYQRSVFLLNKIKHYDTGFVLAIEKNEVFSPTGIIHYCFYDSDEDLKQKLAKHSKQIKHIYSRKGSKQFGDSKNCFHDDFIQIEKIKDFLITKY